MVGAGNRVVVALEESGGCYVEEVKTGKRSVIEERNGNYELDSWVKREKGVCPVEAEAAPGFIRLGADHV